MDTPQILRRELVDLQAAIMDAGASMPQKAREMSEARAKYEDLKNAYLITMFAEEADESFKGKRTVDQRTAMYRSLYASERLQASLAENEYKAQSEYLRALQSALTALQTRARIAENEYKAGAYST